MMTQKKKRKTMPKRGEPKGRLRRRSGGKT
jgi:hypothetical protein